MSARVLSKAGPKFKLDRFSLTVILGLLGLGLLLLLYTGIGSVSLTPDQVWDALLNQSQEPFHRQIVWELRFPRGLTALVAGALLGLAGAILQSITRNPLAEPSLTGVSSGGVFAIVIWLSLGLAGGWLPLVALLGGLAAGGLVYWLNQRGSLGQDGRSRSNPVRLALYGLVMAVVLQSLTSLALVLKQDISSSILLWLIGSLNGRTWVQWNILWPYALVALPLGLLSSALANVLHLGDEVASGLGLRVEFTRAGLFALAALLTASAVAIVGAIGFIGLIGPHIARKLVGDDARRLFVTSALAGAWLLLGADWLAQVVTKGNLPAGVVTAFLGVPFFLYLTLRRVR